MLAQRLLGLSFLGLVLLTGCSFSGGTPIVLTRALPQGRSPSQYISHVVVIIQENRSFENFFTGYPGANAPSSGCAIPERNAIAGVTAQALLPGSDSHCPRGDVSVPLRGITFDSVDLGHDWRWGQFSWDDGKMDGFSKFCCKGGPYPAYTYVKRSLIKP